ncbi:TPA: hypothetical protein HA246_05510 [Candidatus Woesearchaeota archaeon]|nr:hypothetical protein [Candidatus Woesearchaeota archaeon]
MAIDKELSDLIAGMKKELGDSNPLPPVAQRPLPYVDDVGVFTALRVLGRVPRDADPVSNGSFNYKRLEDPEVRKQFLQEVIKTYANEFSAYKLATEPRTVDPGVGLEKIIEEARSGPDGTSVRLMQFLDRAKAVRGADGKLPDDLVLYAAEVLKDGNGQIDYTKLKDPALRKSFAGRLNEAIVGYVTQKTPLNKPIDPNLSAAYVAIVRYTAFNGNFRHTPGSAGEGAVPGYKSQAQDVSKPAEPMPQ